MTSGQKKVSAIIIIILVGSIVYLWYAGREKPIVETVPSTDVITKDDPRIKAAVAKVQTEQDTVRELLSQKEYLSGQLGHLDTSILVDKYSAKNISILYVEDTNTIKNYSRNLVSALRPYALERENEITIMLRVLESKNGYEIEKIKAIKGINELTITQLLKIPTPQSLIPAHLALINALHKDNLLLERMANVMDDPIVALEAADQYQVYHSQFFKAMDSINAFFTAKGIVFGEGEGLQIYINI